MAYDAMISLASLVGCSSATFLFTYLGVPVGDSMVRVKAWDLIRDRILKRLFSWK